MDTAVNRKHEKPLIYSCSGCSNVAQLANSAALAMQEQDLAQMSCIAGVGGGVAGLVRLAQSGRRIIALDGCILSCCRACLEQVGVKPDVHLILTDQGKRKRTYTGVDPAEVEEVVLQVQAKLERANNR